MVVDLTIPLTAGMDAFPGEPTAAFSRFSSLDDDNGVEMWHVALFSQLGTHVDAPSHFVRGGGSVDMVPLDACYGPATVLRLPAGPSRIGPDELAPVEQALRRTTRLVIHSGWDQHLGTPAYWAGFPEVTVSAAQMLVAWGVRFLGLDTPTPSLSSLHAVHQTLLGAGVVVAECLVGLAHVPDEFFLCCAPLPLVGLDGSPARIVALVFEEGHP